MKFFGKKIFSVAAAALLGCGVRVYAVPADEGGAVVLSRMDIVDYIILVGAALFSIGIISVLLSMYLGSKKKSFEELPDYDEDYVYPDSEEENTADEEPPADEEIVIEEEPAEETPDGEIAVEPEEDDAEDNVEDNAPEDIADDVPEEIAPEPEEEHKVRITLTGMNNADVKIAEFASVATVGRRGTNDIMISDNAVSGNHCAFTYEDGVVYLKDCGSTNGTLLNGELIEMEEVHAGDIIVLGKHQYRLSITL